MPNCKHMNTTNRSWRAILKLTAIIGCCAAAAPALGRPLVSLTLSSNMACDGLTISTGTLDVASHTLDVGAGDIAIAADGTLAATTGTIRNAGNWANSGTFTAGAGTVILDGTGQTLTGDTSFNNLTKTTATADTLTFAAGSTTTIANTLTLRGASGQSLSLRSATPGTRWNIAPQGARTLAYLSVQDSNNTSGTTIDARGTGSIDAGNNVAWLLGELPGGGGGGGGGGTPTPEPEPDPTPEPDPDPTPEPEPEPDPTPAPLDPLDPSTWPSPGEWGQLPSSDGDNVPDAIEALVPGRPGPDGAIVPGDGNGDGIPDAQQDTVISLPVILHGNQVAWLTFVNDTDPPLVQVLPFDSATLPQALRLPYGRLKLLFERPAGAQFSLRRTSAAAPLSVFVGTDRAVNGFYAENRLTGDWDNIATAIVTVEGVTRIDFQADDGGPYDVDGAVNGQLELIGGPGWREVEVEPPAPVCPYGLVPDTDEDGVPDARELERGTDPARRDNGVFENPEHFVEQLYRDLLQREGEPEAVAFWRARIAEGVSRGEIIEGFMRSPEFDAGTGAIARLYRAVLGRAADVCGLRFWRQQRYQGASLEAIATGFLDSPEFQAWEFTAFDAFVTHLYQQVFARTPTNAEQAYWQARLDAGATWSEVLVEFIQSEPVGAALLTPITVDLYYLGFLGRAAEPEGEAYWRGVLDSGQYTRPAVHEHMQEALEYRARVMGPSGAHPVSAPARRAVSNVADTEPAYPSEPLEVFATTEPLLADDRNAHSDLYLQQGAWYGLLSANPQTARAGDGPSDQPLSSADGTRVAFRSTAGDLLSPPGNGLAQIYLSEPPWGTLRRLTVTATGQPGNGASRPIALDPEGQWLLYLTEAGDLAGTPGPGLYRRLLDGDWQQPLGFNDWGEPAGPVFDADADAALTRVIYSAGATLEQAAIYLHDLETDSVWRLSEPEADGAWRYDQPTLSADGAYVAYRICSAPGPLPVDYCRIRLQGPEGATWLPWPAEAESRWRLRFSPEADALWWHTPETPDPRRDLPLVTRDNPLMSP